MKVCNICEHLIIFCFVFFLSLQRFKENDVEVKRKDGIILLRELAAEVKNFMDFKRNAVMVSGTPLIDNRVRMTARVGLLWPELVFMVIQLSSWIHMDLSRNFQQKLLKSQTGNKTSRNGANAERLHKQKDERANRRTNEWIDGSGNGNGKNKSKVICESLSRMAVSKMKLK